MKKLFIVFIASFLLLQCTNFSITNAEERKNIGNILFTSSSRNIIEDIIVIPDSNPLFGLIGSYTSCWYNSLNDQGLKPMLVHENGIFTDIQKIFFNQYFSDIKGSVLMLGEKAQTNFDSTEILGDIEDVSIQTAKHVYNSVSTTLIMSSNIEDYQFYITAGPIASYLDIPILFFNDNENNIINVCDELNITNAIIIGDFEINLPDINITRLQNLEDIQDMVLSVIKNKFGVINYITLTNPSDVISPYVISYNKTEILDHIDNIKITFLGNSFDIKGYDSKDYFINISEGVNRVEIFVNITKFNLNLINPVISLNLYDSSDNLVAYSSSLAYDRGSAYLETLICNATDTYTLVVKLYNGFLGGYFSQRGISIVNFDYNLSHCISKLERPHLPYIPDLSIISSYLTSAHGGIIIASPEFELTDETYSLVANGYSSGPWYNENLHNYTNEKVRFIVEYINNTLDFFDEYDLLDSYLDGPAWCAILAGNNMIPMYYYSPSQTGILEKGLPSDNPYSLNNNLSISRLVGWSLQDVSLTIARTLFYSDICDIQDNDCNWHNKFNFIFGEGFGETGGIFHQIPYSKEIKKYGFNSNVYGDLRNGRIYADIFNIYSDSNYIEYLGHGDWFWFTPSLYGLDIYSKAIDVASAKDWTYKYPSVFLTSACLMGRIDGISPRNSIGLTMLHAGCNCFLGATRETGQEAGLTNFENHLIIDNYSIAEALRGEKRVDKELPTYYVRTLFGDPAFNPYEPNNGFSNQGRPILIN